MGQTVEAKVSARDSHRGDGVAQDEIAQNSRDASSSDLRQAIELLAMVGAPLTIIGALAYYIGRVRQDTFLAVFGLNSNVLDLSYSDYVLRSTDTLIRYLVGVSIGLLICCILTAVVGALRIRASSRTRRRTSLLMFLLASLLIFAGASALFGEPRTAMLLMWPGLLGLGTILLWLSFRWTTISTTSSGSLQPTTEPNRIVVSRGVDVLFRTGIVVLVLLSLFWSANAYARIQGAERGVALAGNLSPLSSVKIYSTEPLGLEGPGVTELPSPTGGFETSGYRVFARVDDRMLLIPSEWTQVSGGIVVLKDGPNTRLQFDGPDLEVGG